MKNLKYRKGKIVEAKENDMSNFYKQGDRLKILFIQYLKDEVDYLVINLRTNQKFYVWESEVN